MNWLEADASEPTLKYLPSDIWVMGLGHLGQAYLWALALLPYDNGASLSLMLQDVDVITPSSESTCILSDRSMEGWRKTRVMAKWAERRGFKTFICERLFDNSFRRQQSEAPVALCGIDNALGPRSLDQAGFDLVVEAGLGRSHRDYSSIRLHTLPGSRKATEIWSKSRRREDMANQVAYQELLATGRLDQCGVTQLAGKAVGAPFVGAAAACLAVAELLRALHEGPLHSVLEIDLQSIEHRTSVRRSGERPRFNSGFVRVS